MADHRITITEFPHGKIRSIIADGTHWVSVAQSGINASVASKQARKEMLLVLKGEIEDLPDALTGEPGRATVLDAEEVIDIINKKLKEF